MTHRDGTCLLCGTTSLDVKVGLIRWREPIGRDVFTSAPRCLDRPACRARLEAAGEVWDVLDAVRPTVELVGR